MSIISMKTDRFLLAAGTALAMAFTFNACSGDSDDDPVVADLSSDSGVEIGDDSSSSGEAVILLCNGQEYDSNIYRCESGELIGKCRGVDFYPAYQACNNGVIEDRYPLSSSPYVAGGSSSSVQQQGAAESSSSYAGDGGSSSSVQSSSSRITCASNFLGMGYNVITSAYINFDDVVKNNVALDNDKLCQAGVIVTDDVSGAKQDFNISVGKSVKTLYSARNAEFGLGVNFFVGSIGVKYDTQKSETLNSQVYYAELRSYKYTSADRITTNKQNLSNYLTDEFVSDLSSKTAEQILNLYGTHIFISYNKGGYLEANYTYYGTKLTAVDSVRKAVEGTYKMFNGTGSTGSSEGKEDIEENTTFRYRSYGGDSLSATSFTVLTSQYRGWVNSISGGKITIAGISSNFDQSLVPIWELAEGAGQTAKATALRSAFNALAATQGVAFPGARIFKDTTYTYTTSGGSATNFSRGCGSDCTIVEAEIYAHGAGGGGQGGDNTWVEIPFIGTHLNEDIGTGGAGGGGGAVYARLGGLGLAKGAAIVFDEIAIGKGGGGGPMIKKEVSGQHSGSNGYAGGATRVVYKGTRIVANGGSAGGGNSPLTNGGAGGTASATGNYLLGDAKTFSGTAGNNGNWQQDVRSKGGDAGSVPANTGFIKSKFGGGIGGVRSQGGASITLPEPGGGGSGGYSANNGSAGGRGELRIVLKYFMPDDKNESFSGSDVTTSASSAFWDLSTMGMGISTGGGWYGYDDSDADGGNSKILFYDEADDQLKPANDIAEWNGAVRFSLDPNSFEYAYAGTGFVWLDGAAVAPTVFGNHTGLCLEYSLSGGGDYYLRITTDGYTEYNEFKISLPKQASVTKRLFLLSDFEQGEGWGTIGILGLAKQRSIGMQIQGEAPLDDGFNNGYTTTQNGFLTIKSLRWDSCN